jgi:hypothetical protein
MSKEKDMKYKPRLHSLFFIYIFFGGVLIGLMYYAFNFIKGQETEKNYLNIKKIEIQDTIADVGNLPSKDYAYTHTGLIKTIRLKNNISEFALYLESYENLDKIKTGDIISKKSNSNRLKITSNENYFFINLKNIKRLRRKHQKGEGILWGSVYILLGIIIMHVPMKR